MGDKLTSSSTQLQVFDAYVWAQRLRHDLACILGFDIDSDRLAFYLSSLTQHNQYNTTEEIREWVRSLNSSHLFEIERVPLTELKHWSINAWSGDIEHDSGQFFAIRGLRTRTNTGAVPEWSQPIIHQPEVGILGFLAKEFNGVLHFLVQAKAEPGNINTYQLSPTVQATRSNYTRVHGGAATPYLEYFIDSNKSEVLVDQLQSEQGARFFRKRNRNMIVQVSSDEKVADSELHRWMTLGQLLTLMQDDNTMNMDARSVLACIDYGPRSATIRSQVDVVTLTDCLECSPLVASPVSSFGIKVAVSAHPSSVPVHSMESLLRMITRAKFATELESDLIALNDIRDWRRSPMSIEHQDDKYFRVLGVRVRASTREVHEWDQPIVEQCSPGLVGFVCKQIGGVLHFLVQLKTESGVLDLLEMAPSVQCITSNYAPEQLPPQADLFLNPDKEQVIVDCFQSEEGGRFYHEANENMILFVDDDFEPSNPEDALWMTIRQMKELIRFNNFLNVESRSALACLELC
jgi:oxidase EvaA